jgi:hypothetical protein
MFNFQVKRVSFLFSAVLASYPGFNFVCISCILCYHAAKIVQMFHIPDLFLIRYILEWGWFL